MVFWKLFHVGSNSLEMVKVLCFLKIFLEFSKKREYIPILKILNISRRANSSIVAKWLASLKSSS